MLIGLAALVAQFSVGCGGDAAATAPPPIPIDRSSADGEDEAQDPKSAELDPVVVSQGPTQTPAEETKVYSGTLATTATVPFGGGGFCKYDVTLRDVAIEFDLLPTGDVGRATVRDLAVERALDGCPHSPMAPSIQDFTFASRAVTTTGTRIEFAGAKSNRPETALVVDLVPSGSGYEATATWKRTDQTAPLAWAVTAKVSLAKK
jgi:hypothetical protein